MDERLEEKAADGDTSLFIEDEAAIYQSIRAELTDSLDQAGFTCVRWNWHYSNRIFRSTRAG